MSNPRLQTRAAADPAELSTRLASLSAQRGLPATIDEQARSVQVVAATEDPARVFDYERWEVLDEVLLMSGLEPMPQKVPMLDAHNRVSSSAVLGSIRGLRVEGDQLIGTAFFSAVDDAEEAFTKVREGHLTDLSVGYRVDAYQWIEAGKTATIEGRSFAGPIKIATKWQLHEVSVCPIGADEAAKVRAAANGDKHKEKVMKKEMRLWLEARGLAPDSTEEQAWAFYGRMSEQERGESPGNQPPAQPTPENPEPKRAEATPPAPAAPANPEEAARAAVQSERERVSEIRAMCAQHGVTALESSLVDKGVSVDEARKAVLSELSRRVSQQPQPGFYPSIEMGADALDKFRAAATDGLMLRGGLVIEKPAAGCQELRGLTLRELARAALNQAGHRIPGDPMEMVGRALTTSDLPNILANVANNFLLDGYMLAPETWQQWCSTRPVNDFKPQSLIRPSELGDLEEVPQDGEYKYDKLSDWKEMIQVLTYGKLFRITRQAIINDDMGALTDMPSRQGRSAARKVGDIVYAVLLSNGAMADGQDLFHADHGNLLTGAAVGVESLGAMLTAFALQKDISGHAYLNIPMQYILTPPDLMAAHAQFFHTIQFAPTAGGAGMDNPYRDPFFTRISDPRLHADPAAWYGLGPKGYTVTVGFLNGNQTPYMETKQGWHTDGVEYKVRIDCAAVPLDWKAMAKNPGPGN